MVVEFQFKSGNQLLSKSDVEKETLKSVVVLNPKTDLHSVFVLVSTGGFKFSFCEKMFDRPKLQVHLPTIDDIKRFLPSDAKNLIPALDVLDPNKQERIKRLHSKFHELFPNQDIYDYKRNLRTYYNGNCDLDHAIAVVKKAMREN